MIAEFYNPKYRNDNYSPPHQLFKNSIDENGLSIIKKSICEKY
jgi:hypothetical protein